MKEERLVRVSLTFRTTFDGSENLFGRFVLVHGELFQVEDKTKNRSSRLEMNVKAEIVGLPV